MLGHLNNARYLDYFLNAREDQVAEHYDLNMGELARQQQAAWVVTKHHINYLKPARQGNTVKRRGLAFSADGHRLLALLWSELTFVQLPAGTRLDHSDALMDMLDELDVPTIDYDPDGFDERVKTVRQELKKLRRLAGETE